AEIASLRQSHGGESLPCARLRAAIRLNLSVRRHMSRAILGAFFGVLAALGLAGIFFSASALPDAVANFSSEPEDVYLAAFWLVVFLALVGAWTRAALLSVTRVSPHPL